MGRAHAQVLLAILLGAAVAGCTAPTVGTDVAPSTWTIEYEVNGEFASGSLLVVVHAARETVDATETRRLAVPIEFLASDGDGRTLAHVVHWVDETFSIVRTDERCFDGPACNQARVLFGSIGSPAPFGLFPQLWVERSAFDGSTTSHDFVSRHDSRVTIAAGGFVHLQYFQLPNGTFVYDGLPVPVSFTGLLLPFGAGTAIRTLAEPGAPLELPIAWPSPGMARGYMAGSTLFPGDEIDVLQSGASAMEAWAELTRRSDDLSESDRDCITAVSVSHAGSSDGYVGDLGEFNFTNFAFTLQGQGTTGVRHSIDVNHHWVRGQEWFVQDPQPTVSYGQCMGEGGRRAALNLTDFLVRAEQLPNIGPLRGVSAKYWMDDVQPFGLSHERLRFAKSFAVDAGWTPYVEMDAASGAWYRWFGPTDAMEELGLFRPV